MKLFDSVLFDLTSLFSKYDDQKLSIDNITYEEGNKDQIIFKSDAAYELGGGTFPAVSGIVLSSQEALTDEDEVHLIGEDLSKIKSDVPYARIVIIKTDDSFMGEGNALYQAIRKIDYVRYHVYPKGFMTRISSFNQKESALVDKTLVKDQVSFANIGKLYIDKYHQQKGVKAVKIYFITDPKFDYKQASGLLTKSEDIITALDHLLNKVKMDCHSCSLQKVCEEVEQLVNTDFKKEN